MKTVSRKVVPVTLTAFLSFVVQAAAQFTQPPPLVSIVSVNGGATQVAIKNVGTKVLTAYVMTSVQVLPGGSEGKPDVASARTVYDCVIGGNQKPVGPGGVSTVRFGAPDAAEPTVVIRGGLYDDGASFGDTDWADLIVQRRKAYVEAIDSGLADLTRFGTTTMTAEQAADAIAISLERLRAPVLAQLAADRTKAHNAGGGALRQFDLKVLSDEDRDQCLRSVYHDLITNLKTPLRQSDGTYLGYSESVAALTQLLSARRDQVAAALIGK